MAAEVGVENLDDLFGWTLIGMLLAVPVYGCGFLHENSYWLGPQFAKMTAERRHRWVEQFDLWR